MKEKFQTDDYLAIPQGSLYNVDWQAESDPSILEHLKTFHDPITFENVKSCDAVAQEKTDRNSPHTHSTHDAGKVLKTDRCVPADTSTENGDTLKLCHGPNTNHYTETIASTDLKNSTNLN